MVKGIEDTAVAPWVLGWVQTLINHVGLKLVDEGQGTVLVAVEAEGCSCECRCAYQSSSRSKERRGGGASRSLCRGSTGLRRTGHVKRVMSVF